MAQKEIIKEFIDSIKELCDSIYCKVMPNTIVRGCTNGIRSMLPAQKSYYTTIQLCDKFGVSTEQIRRMYQNGYFIKIGRNMWDKDSVDNYYINYYTK